MQLGFLLTGIHFDFCLFLAIDFVAIFEFLMFFNLGRQLSCYLKFCFGSERQWNGIQFHCNSLSSIISRFSNIRCYSDAFVLVLGVRHFTSR